MKSETKSKSNATADKKEQTNKIVMPGDIVEVGEQKPGTRIIIGPGLRRYTDDIIVTKAGVLRHTLNPLVYWVDCHQRRYVPAKGELVVGVVNAKAGDFFRVDIGSSEMAMLSYLSFENVTKKMRPDLDIGDVVYARLLIASPDMEPEIVCVESTGKRDGLGKMDGGFLFVVSLHYARRLLSKSWQTSMEKTLGQAAKFELTVGLNGRVWIRADSVPVTVALANAIQDAEGMGDAEAQQLWMETVSLAGRRSGGS